MDGETTMKTRSAKRLSSEPLMTEVMQIEMGRLLIHYTCFHVTNNAILYPEMSALLPCQQRLINNRQVL